MGKQADIDKLTNAVRDAEAQLKVFKHNLGILDREIAQLNAVEAQLDENIKFLRKKNIVALAKEYKAAKDDMNKTKNRLAMLRIDRSNIDRATSDIDSFVNKTKEELTKLLNAPSNVLYGLFRRKNGQE